MSAGLGRVPFVSAGVVHRLFHPLRCVVEFTRGNKEVTKADTLQHRKKRVVHGFNIKLRNGLL